MTRPESKPRAKAKRKPPARTARPSGPKHAGSVWSVQDAKNSFSAVVDAAQSEPQTVTRHGRRTAVIVAADEYDRLQRLGPAAAPKKSFIEHLLSMPQDDGEFERMPVKFRDVEF